MAEQYVIRAQIVPCQGGWCRVRERCAHYSAPPIGQMRPADRLCPANSDDPNPINLRSGMNQILDVLSAGPLAISHLPAILRMGKTKIRRMADVLIYRGEIVQVQNASGWWVLALPSQAEAVKASVSAHLERKRQAKRLRDVQRLERQRQELLRDIENDDIDLMPVNQRRVPAAGQPRPTTKAPNSVWSLAQ
jgi:hypothetical protein